MSRPVGAHRATRVRPRYGRLAVLGTSVAVTAIAVLGSSGVLPTSSAGERDQATADRANAAISDAVDKPTASPSASPSASPTESPSESPKTPKSSTAAADDTALPADSGEGKRVVFSEARQRVWLVDADGEVRRTYLVSGSVLDNLDPGSYEVYSRSRWAVGVDDSGVMEYFARFTKGPTGAAIGFHTIPTKQGEPLQAVGDLGTPQSHGCIRQKETDAVALWEFAPIGTDVVVTA